MPFAGDFDHLHHEPLEWLIETGLVGVTAWGAIVVLALRAGAGSGQASRRVALAALAAVAVVSLADFPLHRPADHLAAWLALSVAARTR
jgi:O-antigen ligase